MTLTNVFSQVLNMSMTASFVILAVILARIVLKKAPKIFSYLLWSVVLFRLLSPVSIPSPYSALSFIEATIAQSEGTVTSIEYVDTYREVIVKPLTLEVQPERPVQTQISDKEVTKQTVSLKNAVPFLWLTGAVGMLLFGIVSYLRFRGYLVGAVPIDRSVYLADHVESAYVTGLIFPKIYLPSHITENELAYILAHEKCHLKKFDHVTRHLAFFALCVHWFNPFAWAAFILSGKDMEMSCDEAVIQKLGEGIRTEYTATLLSLVTNQRIVFGSPLAFGEGDTKERILNMTKWKKPKKWVSILSILLCLTVMTACASNPTEQAVISKNDGSFDTNVVKSAGEGQTSGPQKIKYAETFTSTDGSVVFTLNIDETIDGTRMPVVEVEPHFFTSEDAKRIAGVLFGDADFYESEPTLGNAQDVLSRQDAQDAIDRWLPFTSGNAWNNVFPYWETETVESAVEFTKESIETYSELLDTLPEENAHVPAQWKIQSEAYYTYTPEQIQEENMDISDYNEGLSVTTTRNGIPYTLSFSMRDRSDFKISNMHLNFAYMFSPHSVNYQIWRHQMYATEKPTEEQMRQAQEKAQAMLDQMGIGTWKVDDCYLEVNTMSSVPQYAIKVSAVPVFENVAAMRRNQIGNLRSSTAYASSFYLTDANFSFNADSELVECEIFSPVDVTQVVNPNTAIMSMDELIQRAKKHISLSDMENYGMPGDVLGSIQESSGEQLQCEINISQLQYGLIRVKAPNTDDSYYYVPGMILSGSVDYVGKNSGTVYEASGTTLGVNRVNPLVAINAVDGSIIELQNPS